jgi:hypothetical protein
MKKHDDKHSEPPPPPMRGEQDIAKPAATTKGSAGGGTGAAPDPGLSPDPNQDTARQMALDTYNQKVAAGEDPGEKPPAPVAMSNKPKHVPTGPVPAGMRRAKVISSVSAGGRTYEPGDIADFTDADADSLGANIEAFEDSSAAKKSKR